MRYTGADREFREAVDEGASGHRIDRSWLVSRCSRDSAVAAQCRAFYESIAVQCDALGAAGDHIGGTSVGYWSYIFSCGLGAFSARGV
jgi:hypothetical protein